MKKSPLITLVALSLGLGTVLFAGQPGIKQFDPMLATQIDQMRAELQRQGKNYQVDVNPAMQYRLDQICGLKPELRPFDFQAHAEGGYLNNETEDLASVVLPAKYVGWFSSVKDQGQCGSCWDFSTIATLEAAALKKHGAPQGKVNADGSITTSGDITILSEQQVLSCNPFGYSCNGGYYAFDMLMPQNAGQSGYYPGAIPARAFPYVAQQNACSFSTPSGYTPVSQWGYVGSGNGIPSVYAIKAAIYKWGNVSACVAADSYFQAYTGGVFSSPNQAAEINHAICLVGWDDTKGAWLLKNSWGPRWGVNGFMWIKYGTALVGTTPAWCLD
jgi:Papain family cysteine protease